MSHVPSKQDRDQLRAEREADQQILAMKPIWLKSLSERGITFTRIHGIEPLREKRIEVDGKLEHRCLCKLGLRGEDCGRPGKHAVEKNPVRNAGFIENYTHERGLKMRKASWGVLTGKILPCGNRLVVIDNDIYKGGKESLDDCIAQLGQLPETLKVETGTGGYHLYFKYPADRHIKSIANHPNLGRGLDVKAHGGFVIAPGCLHKCGKRYKVHDDSSIDAEIAFLPDAWLDELETDRSISHREDIPKQLQEAMIKKHREESKNGDVHPWAAAALDRECEAILSAPPHSGNSVQNDSSFNIGTIVGAGLINYHDAFAALLDAANIRGGTSSGEKARKTIESGLTSGMQHPRFPKENENWQPYDEFADFAEALDGVVASSGKLATDSDTGSNDTDVDPDTFNIQKRQLTAVQRLEIDLRHSLHQPRSAILDETPVPVAIVHNPTIHPLRCAKCNPLTHKRPCALCATRLAVTRPRPDDAPCTNGGRFLIKSKNKKKRHKLAGFCPKCCMWGCPKCGYDNEVDHLQNMAVYAQWLIDELDQPVITLQSHDIENPKTEEVPVQHGCYKLILNEENRRKYSNKLTKLRTYFVVDYIGNDNYVFFVFLPLNINPSRLAYTPTGSNGQKLSPLTPTVITFEEFRTEHRLHISNAGRYVKLRKSDWEMCDKLPGARKRHVAVAYCKALRLPKRMISTEENERIDNIVRTEEEVLQDALEFGCTASFGDTREIDRSHRRGLTQCLMKYWRFEFPEDVSDARMNAFIARLTGKEKKKVEVASMGDVASNAQQNTSTGSRCLTYPLIT